jgi:predicted ATPase
MLRAMAQTGIAIAERTSTDRLAPLKRLPVIAREAFVGRQAEIERLAALLEVEGAVVTVVGPPGIGKSRLALEHGWCHVSAGGDVAFVDLNAAATARDVSSGFALALASCPSVPDDVDEALRHVGLTLVRCGAPLLLVDGCEHLLREAAASIAAIRSMVQRARFLVTSREPLGIGGEDVVQLGPLAVPAREVDTAATLERYPSVELFVSRARRVRDGYRLGEDDAAEVASIVRALDGNPLAIELCAARMGVLGTREILRHLSRRFTLLASARPPTDARWSSLEAAIRWSWSLLDAREQAALAQAAVFRGGFAFEAAERVISLGAGAPPERREVLDVLESLREKSLLTVEDSAHVGGERRYSLSESVAAFAMARLEELGLADEACQAHERYYLEWLGPSRDSGHIAADAELRARLEAERLNLLAIHDRCLASSPPRAERALMALAALAPLHCSRGPFVEYLADLDAAQRVAEEHAALAPLTRAAVLVARGAVESRRGRFDRSVRAFEEALPILHAIEARWAEAYVLVVLTGLLPFVYREKEVPAVLERANRRVSEVGDDRLSAILHKEVASTLMWRAPEQAASYLERALFLFKVSRDRVRATYTRAHLCLCQFASGAIHEAERSGLEAVEALDEMGDARFGAQTRAVLALIDQERGQLDRAHDALERVLEVQCSLGNRWIETFARLALADLSLEADRPEDACGGYLEVLGAARPLDERIMTAWALGGLGAATAELGRPDDAAAHLDAAAEQARRLSDPALDRGIELRRGHVDLARARAAADAGDDAAAAELIDAARRRLGAPAAEGARHVERRLFARAPRRVLERAVELEARRLEHGLRVDAEGRWFAVGRSEGVSLATRSRPRLVMKRLVEERRARPGVGVSLQDLFEAGWPGERARPDSVANRVYVTLTRLRGLGLGELLKCEGDGFLLDPSVPLVITEPPLESRRRGRVAQ